MVTTIDLSKLKGIEIEPGIIILETPTPISNTNKMRVLADVQGKLCIIELIIKFA